MTDPTQFDAAPTTPAQEISPEFYIRVNDFIEMANRIERRFDTHHAQIAMLHAVARYSAHHYRTVIKVDSELERQQYSNYVAELMRHFVLQYTDDLIGAAPEAAPSADTSAE